MEIQKTRLETKISSLTKSRTERKRDLALTKRQLSELDGFSTKLERLKRQVKEKDDELSKLKSETDVDHLSQEITDKASKVLSLDREVKNLKLEKSVLESQREITSQLTMKKKDLKEKQQQMKRNLNKCDDDLETIFLGNTPEIDNLKRLFNAKDESVSTRKNELEQKLMTARTKMEHENLSVQVLIFKLHKVF